MPKRLIVNADDLGVSPGVNRGIVEAHTRGILTSTTVMINMPHAPAGLELVAREAPGLGVGLHVNLTRGRPISPPELVRSLVDGAGQFHHISRWTEVSARFEADAITRELRAQFDRFVALAGRPPDHLDAHHFSAYLHPFALHAMLDLAAEHSLPLRNPFLATDQHTPGLEVMFPGITLEAIHEAMARIASVVQAHGPPRWPDRTIIEFYDQNVTLGDLLVVLTNLPEGSAELMCHPGYVDDALDSAYAAQREKELAALTHPSAREVVASEGIELITFAQL